MTVTTQDYANLANHVYEDRDVGRPTGEDALVSVNGTQYRVYEHVDNPRTGYQGTIYKTLDGQDLIVSHRGTEEVWKDGVIADGAMVLGRTNPQAEDAIALTRKALDEARRMGAEPGATAPEVSVTGHSLGGTLAQVTAHHFDLRGETFNAYGAASLDRGIGGGPNDRVRNHVMASDVVSAASPQYGDVMTYAKDKEIDVLHQSGYFENRFADLLVPDLPVAAAARSLGAHSMSNFMPTASDGTPHLSVLDDPQARPRAEEHSRMIADYRGDVMNLRRGVTFVAGGPVGWVRDSVDAFRDPVPAGEPAAREAREAAAAAGKEQGALSADPSVSSKGQGSVRQDSHVIQLMDAARANDPDGVRVATQDLYASPMGRMWQQQADQQAQQLNQREAAQQQTQQQALHQRQPGPEQMEMARGGG
ncbi:lipase [Stenotrophomonas sp. S41]|uniref:lipase n=1 Tax=Stenotrophomonas sp. S41 TaxID=2767464 RepID=UPI00190A8718|nr:lipase [Stenotrophomonas sp. S41]MBK0014145.1 lipase [Stenotrophomonas sp. S41]